MNLTRFLYFIATIVEVAKSSAEADDVSLLAQSLSESKHIVRGSGSNDEKKNEKKEEETSSVKHRPKRMLEAGTKRLLQLIEINLDAINFNLDCNDDDEISNPPSMSPSSTPSITINDDKDFVASDGSDDNEFGRSCSLSGDLVVIAAPGVENYEGAAYLFHLDGTEVKKLTPNDGKDYDLFGESVSMDEKIVVGTLFGDYVQVFSREGIYERTLTCDDCSDFGNDVATHGNLIVVSGYDDQNSIKKLLFYSTEGELLKSLEQEDFFYDVAISEQFIVSTGPGWNGKTIIYSNVSPDFPEIAEINQGGYEVAVLGDRIVIGDYFANNFDGAAWLYKTDGTLITALDRQDSSSGSNFGSSVAITDDKVIVGAYGDDDQGSSSGSVFIYSAVTGEFVEKVVAPDGEANGFFGSSVCASDSYYVVGAYGVDDNTGAAYLFQLPEE